MVKRKQKKLSLKLETLRQLNPEEIKPAVGGCLPGTTTAFVSCITCVKTHCC